MTVAFVILHYKTLQETRACIDSLFKLEQSVNLERQIVVVDNASNNGSLEALQEQYGLTPAVHFIALRENLGFARGNNAGFAFAKQTLEADFIILLNNDTEIRQPDFMVRLVQRYDASPFDVLGPDIVTLNQQHQNPKSLQGYSREQLRKKIRQTRRNLWLNRSGLYQLLIAWDHLKKSRGTARRRPDPSSPSACRPDPGNVVLHGSCLVFSPRYTSRFQGLYDGTFLYCEEEILWAFAQLENLHLVFEPSLQILHKEDRATGSLLKSSRQKRLFKLGHELDSLRQLEKMMSHPELFRAKMSATTHAREEA